MTPNSDRNRIKVENLLNNAPARGMSSHRKTPSGDDIFDIFCDAPSCNRKFASMEALLGHKKRLHADPTSYICAPCGSSFSSSANLSKHKRRVHQKLKPFKCDQCSLSFAFKDGMVRHVHMIHEQIRPFTCNHCFLQFKTKAHLNSHSLALHPELHRRSSSSDVGSSSKLFH